MKVADTSSNSTSKFPLLISVVIGLALWFSPIPQGIEVKAWHLFAIFITTLSIVISGALPMGAGTLAGLTLALVTKTLTFSQAFSGYSNSIVWLILIAIFISHGLIHTGLGQRIAYIFIRILGKNLLGVGYGIALTELVLAPAIPSVTARSGGTIYPIIRSLAQTFGSRPDDDTRNVGAYLIAIAFQATVVTSGMFLTAMAPNPMAASLAKDVSVELSWSVWFIAAIVPGSCCLVLIPWICHLIFKPKLNLDMDMRQLAKQKLKEMGKMSRAENLMLYTFLGLLFLWIFGSDLKDFGFNITINATEAALIALIFLLATHVLKWKDLLKQSAAWDTFIWFGALIAMAEGLNQFGITTWFGNWASSELSDINWIFALAILYLVYYYIHYLFASATAHIGALYGPFVAAAVAIGAPPFLVAILFACSSSLFGGLTHYGIGPAPILFGSGYIPMKQWWRIGFLFSIIYIVIWTTIGPIWWYLLGYIH